ncbi:MAG: hypothetical protein A3H71_03490 [Candidatus Sungbacteria bacterium RIFCSPLOWO2_02_FULL_48_13b]|uniref:Uncharacterized protein n=2 Tax=Candidatus Sungiibacteriota TaxID=1817917 RepID=A0A1G2LF79_9BACT|nr:MAG: hypothetical protein A3C12_02730 [Candidatus Sungbacteria bacterium RIFCSPHIGHO2_02_FULL_49_20]OHA10250.1 MAG: hypothetical protein A3H71_03490 [Candidatus Sungbacteria bacterium RIFCSPLOWO2_02_FULL_48_13b]
MDGVLKCSRYAFGPNRLHYCGPDANREIFSYIQENQNDAGLEILMKQFRTMYPYLRRIATSNGIQDPFDIRVVEAYWIGNQLLENISRNELYRHLVDDHGLKKKLDIKSFTHLTDLIGKGALPHHSFHVFAVWKRTGHEEKAHTLESMDSCRISWGLVTSTDGPFVTVQRKPLTLQNSKLALGELVSERFTRTLDARDDIESLTTGKIVTIHWGVLCETISKRQATMLQRYTLESIALANQII